jgi:hypothetical protein
MRSPAPLNLRSLCLALISLAPVSFAGELSVVSVVPAQHSIVPRDSDVVVAFDRAVLRSSVTSAASRFRVFGEHSGPATGAFQFENGDQTVRFTPIRDFAAGEVVRVVISGAVQGADGAALRRLGYSFEFVAATAPSTCLFKPVDGTTTRVVPTEAVRVYGGLGGDFDRDGYLDLALINEDSADVRVLRNRGDDTGHFEDLTLPGNPVDQRPSPGVTADLNVDGIIDIVTSNTESDTISLLYGVGDGTFLPRVDIVVDNIPRGVAVLEANGDGYPDIVTANYVNGTGNVALVKSDGIGGFHPTVYFDAGITTEYAIDAIDMNNDGMQDLVVAGRDSQEIVCLLALGNESFVSQSNSTTGGATWRILCGDIDGDGDADVTTGNGISANAAQILNDGSGNLGAPTIFPGDIFTVDTDLGDLDGDGDLDWIISSHVGGWWRIYENDGVGSFALIDELTAILRPAGVVMMDIDNDNDLDLALMDEIADVITFMETESPNESLFCFGDGTGLGCPCGNTGYPGHGCDNAAGGSGGVNLASANYAQTAIGQGTVELIATGFDPLSSATVIPIRATSLTNDGVGALLGDGLICIGRPVVRLKTRTTSAGEVAFTVNHFAGSGLFHYQFVYDDLTQGYCSADLVNTSNAISITW